MKKGNIPVYVSYIISFSTVALGYYYTAYMNDIKSSISNNETNIATIEHRTTVLETNYTNIKDSEDKINVKLDKILNKF